MIEEKKSRRENLNIFVLSAEEYGMTSYNSELSIFFKLLSKNINDPRIPSRFQLAIECQGHWFCVDCYIKNNQLYLLILDASVLDGSAELIKNSTQHLNPVIFFYRGIQIQYDFERCSFFTLDHLFRLSNRNQHWNDLLNFNFAEPGNITYFDHESCPSSLAFIFKNMQSFKSLDKLSPSLKNSFINKHKITLDQFITENSRSRVFMGVEDKINAGILLKEKKYMERGHPFFKPANYRKMASNRQGFEVIAGEVGALINELIKHKGKIYLKTLIKENEILIKDNIRNFLDVAIYYGLNNFLVLLIERKLLNKALITTSDIYSLMNKDINIFKTIFEHVKNSLDYTDILEIGIKISSQGNSQFKQYFASMSFEKADPYPPIFLPF
ncbi:hypothetical protein [Rickettsiella endosymbiont of Xylota segnis]|uniref:hypothetical protein n=1 Tax=Rickettsiella endosymbiont of Xylota segnis TaxID=3066238 RepID=UPI0030D60E39